MIRDASGIAIIIAEPMAPPAPLQKPPDPEVPCDMEPDEVHEAPPREPFYDLIGQVSMLYSDLHAERNMLARELTKIRNMSWNRSTCGCSMSTCESLTDCLPSPPGCLSPRGALCGSRAQKIAPEVNGNDDAWSVWEVNSAGVKAPTSRGRAPKVAAHVDVPGQWEHFVSSVLKHDTAFEYSVRNTWQTVIERKMACSLMRKTGRFDDIDPCDLAAEGPLVARSHSTNRCSVQSWKFHPKRLSMSSASSVGLACKFRVLHPHSRVRLLWVLIGAAWMFYDCLMVSLMPFEIPLDQVLHWIDFLSNCFWTLDILLCFQTGTVIDSQVVMEPRVIAYQYAKTWFMLDLLIVFNTWLVYTCDVLNIAELGAFKYLRFIRFSRLVRLIKYSTVLADFLALINSSVVLLVLEVLQFLVGIMLWIHISACILYAINKDVDPGIEAFSSGRSVWHRYIASAHWSVTQTQGSAEMMFGTKSSLHLAYAVTAVVLSIILIAFFVSRLTNILMELHEIKQKHALQVRCMRSYLSRHNISKELAFKVRAFVAKQQTADTKRFALDDQVALKILPRHLKGALLQESLGKTLNTNPVFRKFHQEYVPFFQTMCIEAIRFRLMLPDERLFSQGERCLGTYIVESGQLRYYHYGTVAKAMFLGLSKGTIDQTYAPRIRNSLLRPIQVWAGDFLAEGALWMSALHAGDTVTATEASVLVIDSQAFEEVVTGYPRLHLTIALHAKRFLVQFCRRLEKNCIFDMYTSGDLEDDFEPRAGVYYTNSEHSSNR